MGNSSSAGSYNASATNTNIQTMYNVTQYNNELICSSSCVDRINDVYIIIENSEVGDINFDQECSSYAYCVSEYDIAYINTIQQTNANYTEQSTTKTPIPNTFGLDTSDTDIYIRSFNYNLQSTYNATYINISTNCKSNVNNVQENIYITVKNSKTGDINFTQKGNSTLSCESVNSTKATEGQSLLSDSESSSIVKEDIRISTIIILSIFIVFFIVLIIVVYFSIKNDNNNEKYKKNIPKSIKIQTIKYSDI